MAGVWICSVIPTFWALVATVFLIWPGLGVNWFGATGNPNDSLAFLNFSHQRLQYELSQIVPLAIIVVIGIVFYFLGGKARGEEVAVPIAAPDVQAEVPAAMRRLRCRPAMRRLRCRPAMRRLRCRPAMRRLRSGQRCGG